MENKMEKETESGVVLRHTGAVTPRSLVQLWYA